MRPLRVAARAVSFVALASLLLPACESAVKEPKTPTPTAQPAPPPVAEPAASRPAASDLIDVSTSELHVARLVHNEPLSLMAPSEYCLDDGKIWQGSKYRLGRVNVFGLDEKLAAIKSRNPIAILGAKRQGLDSKLQSTGPCPDNYEPIQVQMRSDWVAPEGGPHTTHKKLKELPYIEGVGVREVHMAEFLNSDDTTVRVRLRNPFTEKLSSLTFEAHYEGGRGKPMPTMVEQVLALEPGQWTELSLPRELENQPRTKAGSGLHSLELSGKLGKAELNIEIFVPHQ